MTEKSTQHLLFGSLNKPVPAIRRDLQWIPVQQDSEAYFYFYDSLGYTPSDFAIPFSAQSLLSLINGRNSIQDISKFTPGKVQESDILEYVRFLDQKAVLESPFFRQYREFVEQEYESSEIHDCTLLIDYLQEKEQSYNDFFENAFESKTEQPESPNDRPRALYAPHIDLRVGMEAYTPAFEAVRDLKPKRLLILGTSHYSGLYPDLYENKPFILSGKSYDFTNHRITNDEKTYKQLQEKFGSEKEQRQFGVSFKDRAFRIEHSIEIHLLFLQHLWDHEFEVLPILIGNIEDLFYAPDAFRAKQVDRFAGILAEIIEDPDTFTLISGDLCHVGKRFGDQIPARQMFDEIREYDREFLHQAVDGNHNDLLNLTAEDYDPYRVCGFPPLYLFLKSLDKAGLSLEGTVLNRELWDDHETESAVSFGSVLYSSSRL